MPRNMPRSFLFVPANRPDRLEKAARSVTHQIIVDLEEAVAPEDKEGGADPCRPVGGAGDSNRTHQWGRNSLVRRGYGDGMSQWGHHAHGAQS